MRHLNKLLIYHLHFFTVLISSDWIAPENTHQTFATRGCKNTSRRLLKILKTECIYIRI